MIKSNKYLVINDNDKIICRTLLKENQKPFYFSNFSIIKINENLDIYDYSFNLAPDINIIAEIKQIYFYDLAYVLILSNTIYLVYEHFNHSINYTFNEHITKFSTKHIYNQIYIYVIGMSGNLYKLYCTRRENVEPQVSLVEDYDNVQYISDELNFIKKDGKIYQFKSKKLIFDYDNIFVHMICSHNCVIALNTEGELYIGILKCYGTEILRISSDNTYVYKYASKHIILTTKRLILYVDYDDLLHQVIINIGNCVIEHILIDRFWPKDELITHIVSIDDIFYVSTNADSIYIIKYTYLTKLSEIKCNFTINPFNKIEKNSNMKSASKN